MDIKTYFDKSNTIVYNSYINTAQNPVCELYYGDGYTRVLIHVDTTKIKNMVDDKTFSDVSKLTHILKLKNCWNFQTLDSNMVFNSGKETTKERTSSFDLFLCRMPEQWDSGIGNDFTKDGFITKNNLISENGSNWYNSSTNIEWAEGPGAISGATTGIIIDNIVAVQHFDIGNEDVEMDITNEINSILFSGATNNGFILRFPTFLEQTDMRLAQYVGFFTNKTSTFYKPYLETIYDESIIDDREEFYSNKDNRLYFYSLIGGSYTNLDANPTCSINGTSYIVKQATKGIYYVEIPAATEVFKEQQMYYDIWGGIIYKGKTFNNVELEFVVKEQDDYFNFGDSSNEQEKYVPNIYGIKFGEKINRGDIRKVFVNPRVEYTTKIVNHITGMEYRLYIKEYNKEIDVINYQPVNRTLNSNFFLIDTESLLPNKYFVDIKIIRNDETITHKEKLMFNIVNEL